MPLFHTLIKDPVSRALTKLGWKHPGKPIIRDPAGSLLDALGSDGGGGGGGSGQDGFSPIASVTETATGATISITDRNGTTHAVIRHGRDGANGKDGIDGKEGKSAYEIALANSFDGTEAEWLESLKGADGAGGYAVWSDERRTLAAWGAIPAGTDLKGLTLQEIIAKQVYPFIEPSFASFSISTVTATTLEVGAQIGSGGSARWTISNAENAEEDSVSLRSPVAGMVFTEAGLSASPRNFTHVAWTSNTAGTSTWTISARSKSGATFSKDLRVTWLFKLYFGESASATLDAAGVQALRSGTLKSGYSGSYAYQAGGYKWLAVPANLGRPATFKDTSNNLPVPMSYQGTLSITNAHGVAQDYHLFRTSNVLGGSITIAVA